jgi:ATP-dependent Lon protease
VSTLGIGSSDEVEPIPVVGDERGDEAMQLALRLRGPGYHVYVCGLEGPARLGRIAEIVRECLPLDPRLLDRIYVHNFSDPIRPRELSLPAGQGAQLKRVLATFVRQLQEDLPKAFREETFDAERSRIVDAYEKRHAEEETRLKELASQESFDLRAGPQGNVVFVPLVERVPVETEQQFQALGAERVAALEEARKRVEHALRGHFDRSRDERHRLDAEIEGIERDFARRLAEPRLREIAARFDDPKLTSHLDELLDHLLEHLEPFRAQATSSMPFPFSGLATTAKDEALALYDLNIVVDNAKTDRPPVLVIDSPTYKSLFGTIDRVVEPGGQVSTDFRKIQAGALLRADGGAVILNVVDALVEPFVWRILQRTLRSGRVEIEAYDPFVAFTPMTLRPESTVVQTKVVLVGPVWLYDLLLHLDEGFLDVFKVMADFAGDVARGAGATRALCARVAQLVRDEGLPRFEASALDALIELAVREAGDRRRIRIGSEAVLDAAREAAARSPDGNAVSRADVESAHQARVHRLDRLEERLRDAVERGLVLLDVEGRRVGQINALSIVVFGARPFGRVGRVTASVGIGRRGVVNIEREAKLSGSTHDKAVLLLEGFLRDRFARRRPLSLSASIAFEQSYGFIEGDSASLAELLALLSRIGDFELRQDLAVTGSLNQAGEVQAVGGLSEKIEAFFDICCRQHLTGDQGVVIPAANLENLVLRDDVLEAMEAERFHVIPVRTVDEALEALTGYRAGDPFEAETLNHRIDQVLDQMAKTLAESGPASLAPRGDGGGQAEPR